MECDGKIWYKEGQWDALGGLSNKNASSNNTKTRFKERLKWILLFEFYSL